MEIRISACLMVLLLAGCGGGEDFSAPISGVSERLSKASTVGSTEASNKGGSGSTERSETTPKSSMPADPGSVAQAASSDEIGSIAARAEDLEVKASKEADARAASTEADPVKESMSDGNTSRTPATSGRTTPESVATSSNEPTVLGETAPTTSMKGSPANDPSAKSGEETMTASGRSAKSLADKKEENSKLTVAGNAGGLLGSLKGSKATSGAKTPAPTGDYDAPQILSRFGRMALSQPDWLRTITRLSRRFYVDVSSDGTRILASSGERSSEIVQVNTTNEVAGRYASAKLPTANLLQSITSLPGQIRCVEITEDGSMALFGTEDGRVLVRTISGNQNWDLYARDLFLFQDEIRACARLANEPVVVLKVIHGQRILSIDAKGQCTLWNLADVVRPTEPIDRVSLNEPDSLTPKTVTPIPLANLELQGFQILSCCESRDGQWLAITSSDETVTIIETATGTIVDQLTAEDFADTPPVSTAFLPDRHEILTGLADGRIFRRAFGEESDSVSGVNDAGEPVDYDAVFIPDVRDRPDPVAAIAVIPGTSFAYVGTVTGVISRLDLSQRRTELLPFRHEGAIVELKVCSFGVLAIGDERRATIFDQPVSAVTREAPATQVLALPSDEALKASTSGEPSAIGTRRPQSSSFQETPVDREMIGVRPPQPEMALLHHQLRAATDSSQRQTSRKNILKLMGRDPMLADAPAERISTDPTSLSQPLLTHEIATDFVFTGRAWQDVRISCSQDGRLAVLSHPSRPGISIVDMPTGVVLRRWTDLPTPRHLLLNEQHGRLVPSGPAMAELNVRTGSVWMDPLRRHLVSAVSPDANTTVLGHFGNVGLAANSLTRIDDSRATRATAHEMFESMVTALAYSSNGESLYAAFRMRDQTTLLEFNPLTLAVRNTLLTEALPGAVPLDFAEAVSSSRGVTFLQSSATNRSLLTSGFHEDGPQLRVWRRTSKGWPTESVQIFREKDQLPDPGAVVPATFVNQQDSRLAVITKTGLAIINVKKEKLEANVPVPDVGNRRPCSFFSTDAKWFFVGDAEGNIWTLSLSNPTRKPKSFQAHSGPIAGLALSADGQFLLTAGEDNRVRSWWLRGFLGP